MQKLRIIKWAVFGLCVCVSTAVYGQEEAALLNQLGSEDEAVREKAHDALVEKGASVLGVLFDLMEGENKTTVLWARHTAEHVVYRSTQPGTEKDRAAAEKALLQVVLGEYGFTPKDVAFQLLSLAGRDASVRVLARIVNDADDREMARWALERIPEKSVTKELVRALNKAEEASWKVALLKTLGVRGDLGSKSAVLDAFDDPDSAVRLSAISAAGRLPHAQTKAALWRMWHHGTEKEQEAAADALLYMAEEWLHAGLNKAAESVYRRFNEDASCPLLQCAALTGLAQSSGEKAMPNLLAALKSPNMELRGVALDQLAAMSGEEVTRILVDALETAEGDSLAGLISLVGRRDDSAAATATPRLIQIAREAVEGNDDELKQAVAFALARIPGPETTNAIIEAMRGSSSELQAGWIWILGSRADSIALPVVMECARSSDDGLRIVALKALGRFADSAVAPVLLAALSEENQQIRNAAAESAIPVSVSLEKAGQEKEAGNLCLTAAHATTESGQLRALINRLIALGATEQLGDMALDNGCIVNWWISGPFPGRGKLLESDPVPTDRAVDVSQPVKADEKEYPWKAVRVDDPLGFVDLQREMGPMGDVGVYLYAEVESESDCEVLFKIGSDDDSFCWLNGGLVHEFVGGRNWTPDKEIVRVHLRKGWNSILLKVLNMGSEWAASLRITDLEGKALRLPQKK
ncbi:MAG: HEAT repeat domain-containing protein [bacterium]